MKNPLPRHVIPKHYALELKPDLKKFTFEGKVEVKFEAEKDTKTITMNAIELKIQKASVNGDDVAKMEFDTDLERVTFTLAKPVSGKGSIVIEFTGELNNKMKGFYRSGYKVNGEERFMATTQFEATDARRCFPCWDDPNFKAVFQVTLTVPEKFVALSNNVEVSHATDTKTGLKTVKFEDTPKMSSYLLAFCVGEYDYIETYADNGVRIRVYTELGKSHLGEFALDVAKRALVWYEDFFQETYKMKKLDMIAIPDFAAGAMENWGLVTYRSTALLLSKDSSLTQKRWVAIVVCHELAHMWFGNLITMTTWQYLWLNESFATLMEYLVVDALFPDWKIFNQFVELDFSRAQELDSLKNSHPVEVPLESEKQVDEIFDAISYQKGCSIMRMLQNYVGIDSFKKALRVYMKAHKWTNTVTSDLWKVLSDATKVDIPEIMDNWVKTTGYPVIQVSQEKTDSGLKLSLVQTRFFASGPEPDNKQLWNIPIKYVSSADPKNPKTYVMKNKEDTLVVDGATWVKLNAGQVGLFRVQYSETEELVKAIKSKQLSPIDRFGIQSDVSALAKAGYLDAELAMKLFAAFENEDAYVVMKGVASGLGSMYAVVKSDKGLKAKFQQFAQGLFIKMKERLGWELIEGETSDDSLGRVLAFGALFKYQEDQTIKEALERFESGKIIPDLKGLVFSTANAHGGKAAFEKLLQIYDGAELNEEKVRVLGALGSTEDEALFKTLVDEQFIFSTVRSQDFFYVIRGMANNPLLKTVWWPFFKNNVKKIVDHVGGGFLVGRVVGMSTGEFDTEEELKEVEQVFEDNKEALADVKRSQLQSLETIKIQISINKRCFAGVKKFLDEL